MKTTFPLFRNLHFGLLAMLSIVLFACDDEDAPAKEDTPELITQVKLTFVPSGGGANVVVTATDDDNIGPNNMEPDGPINLIAGTTYTLTLELFNGLLEPAEAGYNVSDEVSEEANEHLFFFSWTGGIANPDGNGNIDNRTDVVNYEDVDSNELPLGLITTWQAAASTSTANQFRIVLKHQPDVKSSTSTFEQGETDVDLPFTLNVVSAVQ